MKITTTIKSIFYTILLVNKQYEKMEKKLKKEKEKTLKDFFLLEILSAKGKYLEWLDVFVRAYCTGTIGKNAIHKYYQMTQICYRRNLYLEIIGSAKKLLEDAVLGDDEKKQILHIWGKSAYGNNDLKEVKLCVDSIESAEYTNHPFLLWYREHIGNSTGDSV